MNSPAATNEQVDPARILADLKASYWYGVGVLSADAYHKRKTWLYRRVESLRFVGRTALRRQVSVDFEMPDLPPLGKRAPEDGRLVPISVFLKWPPLADFDLVGPDGHPRSLYVRDTNKQLDLGVLLGTAAQLAELTPRLQQRLALLVLENEPKRDDVKDVTESLRDELQAANAGAEEDTARDVTDTVNLAAQLANSSILWVPVTGTKGTDCIVKFSYLIGTVTIEPTRILRRLLIACSWQDRVFEVALPHAGQYTRYHLDVDASNAGVEIVRAQTLAFPREPDGHTDTGQDDPGEQLGSSEIIDRHAHIYHPLRTVPSHRVALRLVLAATREGFISGCLTVAVALAVLMTVAYSRLTAAASHLEPFVVLLAAVPLVLGYLMVRTEEPLEREGITGVRGMALLAGILPIAGALALVFAHQPKHAQAPLLNLARPVWAGLTILSWLLVAGLGWSWALACAGRPRSREQRPANIAVTAGLFAAVCILAVVILACPPYTDSAGTGAGHYMRTHLGIEIAAGVLLALGVTALHAVIRAIRRTARRARRTQARRAAGMLLFASAATLIWGTVAAVALILWESITSTAPLRPSRSCTPSVRSPMRRSRPPRSWCWSAACG